MSFLRSLLNCSWFPCCRKPEEPEQDLQIFPVTNSWYVSEYLTLIDQAMVLHGPNGEQKVAIFHGPEDTQYTSENSLKVIEQSLLIWAQGYPGILPVLNAAFPLRPNTIAVSIAHKNFSVAKEPHLFMTNLTEQQMSTGYHSYRWLPNGFQVTYLNLKGQKKRIPAGMCFYTCPTHPRKDSSLLDHRQIVNYVSTGSKNGYWWVVADIVENDTPAGRASKGLEQKMIEISDFLDEENLAPGPQVFKSYPVTVNPYIPLLQDAVEQSLISTPTVPNTESLPVTLKDFFSCFKFSNFKSEATKPSLSMAMKNFNIGKEHFYTVPEDPDSNYHSCMLSESLQACYYTEKGTCYLAGLCSYPENSPYLPEHDAALIYLALAATEYYPKVKREDRPSTVLLKKYGRYCNSAKMLVIVEAGKEDALGSHVKYDWVTNQFVHYYCRECRRDYFEPEEAGAEPEEDTHEEEIARDLLLFLGDISIDVSEAKNDRCSKAAKEANEMLEKLKELEDALEADPAEEAEPEQKPKATQDLPEELEPRKNPSKPTCEPLMDFDNTHKFLFKDLEQ